MEHISVKKKVDRVIITHKLEKNEQISLMEQDIINKMEIPALLPVQLCKTLGKKKLRFTVQNFVTLRTLLKSEIGFDMFCLVVLQVADAMKACESHGIRSGNLELNCDLSFFDYSNKQVRLVCWPLISLSANANIPAFFMELGSIYRSRPQDKENRLQYLQMFDSRARFDLMEFRQSVEELHKNWIEAQTASGGSKGGRSGKIDPEIPPTMDLRAATLQRVSNRSTINVTHYPFSVGRKAEFCDYAIKDNPYLSKRHITILLKNNATYIRDNGSANGTFLDGKRIPANTEVELRTGTTIRIGNEDLVFHAAGD